MTHGSLFSGIGGFDLAAEWMGWQNVFHCEWNTFGQRVLKHYWPDAISYNDITKTDFTIHRGRIDIITGGFPCQPYSMAGKRLGKEDDRHLWPEMLRAIQEIQPRWVVGENVLGLVNWSDGLVFHEVQADLEAEGYEVQPFVLPACAVNAPHRRDRVWFVAHARCDGFRERTSERVCEKWKESINAYNNNMGNQGISKIATHTNSNGRQKHSGSMECESRTEKAGGHKFTIGSNDNGTDGDAADTNGSTTGTPREGGSVEENGSAYNVQQSERREQTEQHNRPSSFSWDATHTECAGLEHWHEARNIPSEEGKARRERSQPTNEFKANGDGKCNATHTNGIGLRRESDGIGNSRFFGENDKASNWETFPTVSPICDGNDGISNRLDGITFSKWRQESIKAGGNAVVGQVVLQIFRTIEEYEKMNTQ